MSIKKKLLDATRLLFKIKFLETALVKMTSDKEYGTFWTKLPAHHWQYKKASKRSAYLDGIQFDLDISDLMDWAIYFGFIEKAREKLYSLINEGDIVLDIGANVGDVTLHTAKIVGKNGMCHAFEPDPVNFDRLLKNISLNQFSNIFANKKGAGHLRNYSKLFTVEKNNRGMNRILDDQDGHEYYSIIEVITIDEYVSETSLPTIDLIKIDTEGFEMNVLKGAVNSIAKFYPKLFLEINDRLLEQQGSSPKELFEFLENYGYQISNATTGESIKSNVVYSNCHFDIVGIYQP